MQNKKTSRVSRAAFLFQSSFADIDNLIKVFFKSWERRRWKRRVSEVRIEFLWCSAHWSIVEELESTRSSKVLLVETAICGFLSDPSPVIVYPWLRLWRLLLVEILKLRLVKILKFKLSRNADIWLRFLKLLLGQDYEDEIQSRFVWELLIWPKEVTLVTRTQPLGPLCLWQFF